ncbi:MULTISPECIES: thiol reductant ABC exporter subunit CydD [Bacillaceae]|uniref:Thiol reductant ABC exporter subunit CydD n=1 Tax=Evansella alkalicola TaxID=745819 RepID=A0ABS6JP79_9BACI|nr:MULTISPECIES: thiol reductant ABC exporter subunit CydD [Bacillaceae]MBU9720369.1 thiol reductant ABC exporter subunit CydD [Bacillus alkalicola]
MKQLKEIARAQKKQMYLLYVLALSIGVIVIGQTYFIVSIVDGVFLKSANMSDVLPSIVGLLMVLLARALFTYLNGRIGMKMASKAKLQFRQKLLSKYTKNPIQASLKGQSGEKVSIMMDAVDEVDSYYSKYYPQMIQTSVVPLIILGTAFYLNWVSGLIMIVTAPFIPIFMIIIGGATQKKSEAQLEKLAAFSGRFLDILQGLTTLKFFGRAKDKQEVIRQSSLQYRDATMDVLKVAFLSSLALEFISMLSIGLIALEVGLRLVVYQHLNFYTAFFVLILAPEFYNSLKELGSAFHAGRGSMGAAKKIIEELEMEEQPVIWGDKILNGGAQPPTIRLENIQFQYGETGFSLQNVSAEISPFAQIAIVGKSGSGKSTLLQVISGLLQPSRGRVNINGSDLLEYKESSWMDQLSYISQDPYLFSGTIRENISIGVKGETSQIELEAAAEKAGIASMIQELEHGYDTTIGEGGRGLSGGEKQRMAIARAFLKKPSVILFDEPTVGLDLQTEKILQESIYELSQSSTVITVAHRLHTIKNSDSILFISNGELVAQGTHDELTNSNSDYRDMVSLQRGDVG